MAFPKFEGGAVAAARLQLNGFGEDLNESLKLGEKVYFVVEAEITDVRHPRAKGIITRHHVGTIVRTAPLDTVAAIRELDNAEAVRAEAELKADREREPGLPGVKDELDSKRRAAGEREND